MGNVAQTFDNNWIHCETAYTLSPPVMNTSKTLSKPPSAPS